ncbi:MAG: hypothetical protein R2764_11090 [Bacteroidales bacterium]
MKKQVLSLIAVSLFVVIAIVSVVSCSKTDQESVNQKGTITHFFPEKSMVEPTITKFIHRFEDYRAGYKTGGVDIKLGEAIWTLEAGVNYEFQSPKEELGDFASDSISFTVDVYIGDDNEYYITESDAMNLYNEMLSFTGNMVSPEDVELLVADLEVLSVEDGDAEVKFETLAGGIDPFSDCNVNITDYWYAANGAGKCSIYEYQYVGQDAASRISVLLNCVQMSVGYWTDIYNTGYVTSYYDQSNNSCFWGTENTGNWYDCLYPTDMDYWWGQAEYVIDDLKPSGKEYINCRFKDEVWTDGDWFHCFENIRYGIPHSGGGH